MKLFVIAALVAAASAARLEHLERSYLPPDNNAHGSLGHQGGNGLGSGNNRFGVGGSNGFGAQSGSHGFGAQSGSNGFGSNGASNGFGANSHSSNKFGLSNGFGSQDLASNRFGSNGQNSGNGVSHGSNGFGSSQGSNSFGSNGFAKSAAFGGAASNQYLPPNHGPSGSESGSNGFNNGGSAIKPACHLCGSNNQYKQGSQSQIPGSNYGVPQLGSRSGASSNDFGPNGASDSVSQVFGSPSGSQGFNSQPQFGAASRQYLAPKYSPSQNPPQQPFDENTGYIY